MNEHWYCRTCGPHVAADEDGCCSMCGRDTEAVACGCETRNLGEWRLRPPTPEELRAHHEAHNKPYGKALVSIWASRYKERVTVNHWFGYYWDEQISGLYLRRSEWRPLDAEGVACEWPVVVASSTAGEEVGHG